MRGRFALPFRRSVAEIGLALGGRAGGHLATPLGLPISPRTMLRVLHALPAPTVVTPRVLGLDDFSFQRRVSFGTMLVDLETRRVIDLLPDRSIAVVSQWLQGHPGVEIVTRATAMGATPRACARARPVPPTSLTVSTGCK